MGKPVIREKCISLYLIDGDDNARIKFTMENSMCDNDSGNSPSPV